MDTHPLDLNPLVLESKPTDNGFIPTSVGSWGQQLAGGPCQAFHGFWGIGRVRIPVWDTYPGVTAEPGRGPKGHHGQECHNLQPPHKQLRVPRGGSSLTPSCRNMGLEWGPPMAWKSSGETSELLPVPTASPSLWKPGTASLEMAQIPQHGGLTQPSTNSCFLQRLFPALAAPRLLGHNLLPSSLCAGGSVLPSTQAKSSSTSLGSKLPCWDCLSLIF